MKFHVTDFIFDKISSAIWLLFSRPKSGISYITRWAKMEIVDEMEVGRRRGMMMGFAPFPVSSSSHQRSLFHRALLKGDSELMVGG